LAENVGWDRVVSITVYYEMKSPISLVARLSTPIRTGPGAHSASYIIGTVLFWWVKQPVRGVNHPFPSSTKVKEGIELYLYSPSVPLWHRVNFTFLPCRKLYAIYKNESVDCVWGSYFWLLWELFKSHTNVQCMCRAEFLCVI